jgi:acyl-coenzyme A synthetase/AMP-(fatty) acid ligase
VPDPICLLVFTSGSTGRPKAVAHTQERLARRVDAFVQALGPDPGPEALLRYLADRVDALSVPVACLAVAQWPVTPRGKTDRQKLTALAVEYLGRASGNG